MEMRGKKGVLFVVAAVRKKGSKRFSNPSKLEFPFIPGDKWRVIQITFMNQRWVALASSVPNEAMVLNHSDGS